MNNVLQSFISSHGYQINEEMILDDHWQTCKCAVTGEKLRYIGRYNSAGKLIFTFGSFQNSTVTWTYKEKGSSLTPEERKKAKADQLRRWDVAKITAKNKLKERSWGERPLTDTYLSRKWPLPTLPLDSSDFTWLQDINFEAMLCLAMKDAKGEIWNVQFIQKDGTKRHLGVARTQGLFLEIPKEKEDVEGNEIYLCEGFATALSVHGATGARTLCCFSSGNITHVLTALKKEKWLGRFVVVCDNDWEKQTNAGTLMRENLLKKFGGILCVQPPLALLSKGHSDYNDIHLSLGIAAVKKDLSHQLAYLPPLKDSETMTTNPDMITPDPEADPTNPTPFPQEQEEMKFEQEQQEDTSNSIPKDPPPGKEDPKESEKNTYSGISEARHFVLPYINGLGIMPPKYNEKGKEIMPEELEVANYVMSYYKSSMIRSQDSFFLYNGSHWSEIGGGERAALIRQIAVAHNGRGGMRRFEAIAKMFFSLVPEAPRDLFIQNPYLVNFKNKALYIIKKENKWCFEFKDKSPKDFAVNTIPIDVDVTRTIKNKSFDSMVLRLLGDDAHKARMVRQMYGAALAPIFPRLFMLLGPKGSGKSSLILGAIQLVNLKNVGFVQPRDFRDPHLASLIGKLVNVVTDIDTGTPIEDSVIKQIEDRVPIAINRKYKEVVSMPLPAVHIFGGNEMPPTKERGSMAHARRWSFIEVNSFSAEATSYSRDFALDAFNECPAGVLNFALDGLLDLLESDGLYFSSEASRSNVKGWQERHDLVSCFLAAVEDGETGNLIRGDAGDCAPRKALRDAFKDWHRAEYGRDSKLALTRMTEQVAKKLGAKTRKLQGDYEISHFKLLPGGSSAKDVKSETGGKSNAPKGQYERSDLQF